MISVTGQMEKATHDVVSRGPTAQQKAALAAKAMQVFLSIPLLPVSLWPQSCRVE